MQIDRLTEKASTAQMHEIVASVAEETGVPVEDIMGRSRLAQIARARQLAMYLCRRYRGAPLTLVGRFFGRHHTTVLHAERAIEAEIAEIAEIGDPK